MPETGRTGTLCLHSKLQNRLWHGSQIVEKAFLALQVMFFPSHNEYVAPAVTRRVMDYYRFMNSKVLFKSVSLQSTLGHQ